MKIIVVGTTGTLGKAIVAELGSRHEIVRAGREGADVKVDITNLDSLKAMYAQVGTIDAVICAAGNVHFGALTDITPEQYAIGLNDKLMGQVNLVLAGQHVINDGGSFTLISGVLSDDPIRWGSSASMVNAAIDAFVHAAPLNSLAEYASTASARRSLPSRWINTARSFAASSQWQLPMRRLHLRRVRKAHKPGKHTPSYN